MITNKKTIASMIVAILLIGLTTPIFAATKTATVKTTTLLYADTSKSTVRAQICAGQKVEVLSTNGNWCNVKWTVTGYAHKNYVNKSNGAVLKEGPNIYSDANHSNKIGDLRHGRVNILDNEKLYGNYYRVSFYDTGYVQKSALNISSTGSSSTGNNKPSSSSSSSGSILAALLRLTFKGAEKGAEVTLKAFSGLLGRLNGGSSTAKPEYNLTLNKTSIEIKEGSTATITATYKERTVTPKYKSSDTNIATVDSSGTVKGIKKGNATITATYNGKKATAKVTVSAKATQQDKPTQSQQTSNSSIYEPQTNKNKNWAYRSALAAGTLEHAICYGEYYNSNHDYRNRITFDPETNIVIVDNEYYCVAIGSYFGEVGDKFIVKLSTGKEIKIIMCDTKGKDAYFKAANGKTIAHKMDNGCKDMLEFYCRTKPNTRKLQDKFAGKVVSITKI